MKFKIGSLVRLYIDNLGTDTGLIHNHLLPEGALGIILSKPSQMSYYDIWNPGTSNTVDRVLVMFPSGPRMVDVSYLVSVPLGRGQDEATLSDEVI